MPPAARVDPYKNFNFKVEIVGIPIAGFSEVSGLDSEVDVIEYREGGDAIVRKLPGLAKVGNITLKRGVTDSLELYQWHRSIVRGQIDRRDGAIILLDDAKKPVTRWKFFGAFPQKYEGPYLNAKGNDVAIETLVLCCEGLERE
ncbi:MAG: phage tail protein [Acidobacteriota bacterium]